MSNFEEYFENYKKTKDRKRLSKKRFTEVYEKLQLAKLKEKILVEELIHNALETDDEQTIKNLQNSYNILKVKGESLKCDGIMGPKTISAINSYKNPLELFVWFNMNQFNYYKENDVSSMFMKEWINERVIKNVKDFFDKKED